MAGAKKSRGANNPKMKSKRSAMKRFSLTASGIIKHGAKGRRHILSNKARKVKRQLKKSVYLKDCDAQIVRRAIPYL